MVSGGDGACRHRPFLVGGATWGLGLLLGVEIAPIWYFVFGALISPTDPVSVLGVLKTEDVPLSLQSAVAGESLFNDGVGVVIFTILVAITGNIDIEAAWLRIAPGQELHLLRVPDFEPSGFEREFGRHFAVEYPADGFAGLKERLAKRGAELIDPIRETPFERFFFRDPNGYIFEVVDADHAPEI